MAGATTADTGYLTIVTGTKLTTLRASSIIIVMGVTGAGKTTVGARLAERLGVRFADADAFHTPASIAKMRAGTPLEDADRESWLHAIRAQIERWQSDGMDGVIACSALKRVYRETIIGRSPGVRLVYLKADSAVIAGRLVHRHNHFMSPSLLDSQFAILEEPAADERPIIVDAARNPDELIAEIAGLVTRG